MFYFIWDKLKSAAVSVSAGNPVFPSSIAMF